VSGLIDDELVVAHLVEGASRCRGADGVNAVDDELITGHGVLYVTDGGVVVDDPGNAARCGIGG
jgi:hypothetical protein